ncbi:MAG TPA: PCRF domain-containing protein, partial [Actinotalea sp.]|nr:PCRF domain-containing protein [Actinotalea sp.]
MAETFDAVGPMLAEYAELEHRLADPALHADPGRARTLGRRYAELGRVVSAYRLWRAADDDARAAAELAELDAGFAAELPVLRQAAAGAAETLRRV